MLFIKKQPWDELIKTSLFDVFVNIWLHTLSQLLVWPKVSVEQVVAIKNYN